MSRWLTKERIGQEIQGLRRAKGWSQKELAARVGNRCDQTQISKWENGKIRPRAETIARIAEVLETPLDVFYEAVEPSIRDPSISVIEGRLAVDLIMGSNFAGRSLQLWILNEIENAFIRAKIEPEDFPEWLKSSREELGA